MGVSALLLARRGWSGGRVFSCPAMVMYTLLGDRNDECFVGVEDCCGNKLSEVGRMDGWVDCAAYGRK